MIFSKCLRRLLQNKKIGVFALASAILAFTMASNLPGMSGVEALVHLKAANETRDIPVLAVTAAAMPHEIENGMKQGFLAYVTKPIQVEVLLQTVRGALKLT